MTMDMLEKVVLRWMAFCLLGVVALGGVSACDDAPATGANPPAACEGDACPCASTSECADGEFCDAELKVCLPRVCEPGAPVCEGDSLMRCADDGSGLVLAQECGPGACSDGACRCQGDEQCSPGESCIDGLCNCPSQVHCGASNLCCGEGELCREQQVCEPEGACHIAARCIASCDDGERCGPEGDICCRGETPVCGPAGECVIDCGAERELCGANLDVCCEAGDVCVFGECRAPGAECERFTDCDFDQYCETTLGRCMPNDFPEGIECTMDGDFEDFEPEVLWRWSGVEINGRLFHNVMSTPMVADLTGNGVPNVAFPAYYAGGESNATVVVIDGATGETIYVNHTRPVNYASQVALADLDGDGRLEIVVQIQSGLGVLDDLETCPDPLLDDEGCYLWTHSDTTLREGGPLIVDFDGDGRPEVLIGRKVFDGATGEVLATLASGNGYIYPAVADLTMDGEPEVFSRQCAYKVNLADGQFEEEWCNTMLPAGSRTYAAVGDLVGGERAGLPELIVTGNGRVYVVAGDTGEILHEQALPGGGNGGAPVVADFDGDGNAEIGIAGRGCYTVFDLDCLGPVDQSLPGCERPVIEPCTPGVDCFEVQACPELAAQMGTGDGILWSVYIQDLSSSRTGSSVFDFQGDGRNEVVYNDECHLMVFDGQTGAPQFQVANTTRTSNEYPVIVDVTGDGRTNIVVAANNDQFNRDCRTPIQTRPDRFPECHGTDTPPEWCTQGTSGVVALQDPLDRWVRTRSIWNQFAYHIDNIGDDGRVPAQTAHFWQNHNTYRANRQGEVPLNAPNIVVTATATNAECPPDFVFSVRVENHGTRGIEAGLPVTLYREGNPQPLHTTIIGQPIRPGSGVNLIMRTPVAFSDLAKRVDFRIVANDDGSGAGPEVDCEPESATALIEDLFCPYSL